MSNSLRPHGCQVSLSFTISWSLLIFISIESVMPSNHLILCHPLLLLPSIFPSIRVFSNESALCIRWPKYWSYSLWTSLIFLLPMNFFKYFWFSRSEIGTWVIYFLNNNSRIILTLLFYKFQLRCNELWIDFLTKINENHICKKKKKKTS